MNWVEWVTLGLVLFNTIIFALIWLMMTER